MVHVFNILQILHSVFNNNFFIIPLQCHDLQVLCVCVCLVSLSLCVYVYVCVYMCASLLLLHYLYHSNHILFAVAI